MESAAGSVRGPAAPRAAVRRRPGPFVSTVEDAVVGADGVGRDEQRREDRAAEAEARRHDGRALAGVLFSAGCSFVRNLHA
jgi:hypothetical protein